MDNNDYQKILKDLMKFYQQTFNQNIDITRNNIVIIYTLVPNEQDSDIEESKLMTESEVHSIFSSNDNRSISNCINNILSLQKTDKQRVAILKELIDYTLPFDSSAQSIVLRKLGRLLKKITV